MGVSRSRLAGPYGANLFLDALREDDKILKVEGSTKY